VSGYFTAKPGKIERGDPSILGTPEKGMWQQGLSMIVLVERLKIWSPTETVFLVPRHSKIPPNLLKHMKMKSVLYSERGLKSLNVPADFDSPMRRFVSSRPSQAVRVSGNFLLWIRSARETRAFLIANSLWRPMFEFFGPKIPKNLRPIPGKFPFSGDSTWRPKDKPTACQARQYVSVSAAGQGDPAKLRTSTPMSAPRGRPDIEPVSRDVAQ